MSPPIWSLSISPMEGSAARWMWRVASHKLERISALAQCRYAASTLTRITSLGTRLASAQKAKVASSVVSAARPFTRKVSSTPGTKNSSPTWPFCTMFSSVSSRLLPGESAMSRVPASSTFTKPGAPPRGEASIAPSGLELATTTSGDWATKRAQCASSCASSFFTERSCGAA